MENEACFCIVSHHGSNQEMFYLDLDFSRLAAVFSPFLHEPKRFVSRSISRLTESETVTILIID